MFVLATTSVAAQIATGIHLVDVRFSGDTRLEAVDLKKCAADLKSRGYEGPDFEKWINALRTHKLLSAEEMKPALTPVNAPKFQPNSEESAAYGFGWFLDPYNGHRRMYHTGTTIGFLNAIEYFPDDDLATVVFCNRTDVKPNARALKMADLFLKPTKR